MKTLKFIAVGLVFVVLGCGQKAKDDVALMVVNGWPLKASFVKDLVLIQFRIAELSGQEMPTKEDFNLVANNRAMRIAPMLATARLWDEEIGRLGLTAEPEDRQKVLSRYGKMLKRKFAAEEELIGLFGEQAAAFRAQFERECRTAAYERKIFNIPVSEGDIDVYLQNQKKQRTEVEGVNAHARKRGQEAWKKLEAGAAWDDVAAEYSEDGLVNPENADFPKKWGTFRPQDLGTPALTAALVPLRAGDYTKPVETDEGLVIVKVLGINGAAYDCARILIRMMYDVDVVENRDEIRQLIAKDRLDGMKRDLFLDLRRTADIQYPLGTNFVYKIWDYSSTGLLKVVSESDQPHK